MNYGTGMLPYDTESQNTIPGGASLWVFGGKSDEEYKGIAAFFNFLSQTAVQAKLHQVSGYLPVTLAAYEETKKSGFYEKNPAREIPIKQMMGKAPTENSKGVRLANLPQVRDIMNEEYEKMLAGEQTAQQALDNIVPARQRRDQGSGRELTGRAIAQVAFAHVAPLSCRTSPPQGGDWPASISPVADVARSAKAMLPISPLVGEMSGRTSGAT